MKHKLLTAVLVLAAISEAAVNLNVSLGDSIKPVTLTVSANPDKIRAF